MLCQYVVTCLIRMGPEWWQVHRMGPIVKRCEEIFIRVHPFFFSLFFFFKVEGSICESPDFQKLNKNNTFYRLLYPINIYELTAS